jgi:malate dehydrogenase (quinone)
MKKFWKYLLVLLLVLIVIAIAFLFRPVTSKAIKTKNDEPVVDVVLIGGGIMSATLGTYLNELQPDWNIRMYERLDAVAQESSNGFNNAGTGHSGFMEMNYTEEKTVKWTFLKLSKLLVNSKLLNSFGHIKFRKVC